MLAYYYTYTCIYTYMLLYYYTYTCIYTYIMQCPWAMKRGVANNEAHYNITQHP